MANKSNTSEASQLEVMSDCGVIMPISPLDGCDSSHWKDVKDIIFASIRLAKLKPSLVSDDTDIGVIHKRIVQNIYENPIIVCDVSGKNPNVMFELGMRLAFDKPVIVVKDDKTPYSFDTSPVEHLTYPRDLRFSSIVDFQEKLKEKLLAVMESKNEHSFLKSFGTFKVAELKQESAGAFEILLEEIGALKFAFEGTSRNRVSRLDSESRFETTVRLVKIATIENMKKVELCVHGPQTRINRLQGTLLSLPDVIDADLRLISESHAHLTLHCPIESFDESLSSISGMARRSGFMWRNRDA